MVRSLVTDAMVEEKEYKSGEGSAPVDLRKDGTWAGARDEGTGHGARNLEAQLNLLSVETDSTAFLESLGNLVARKNVFVAWWDGADDGTID